MPNNNSKVRLVKGPFGGRVVGCSSSGSNEIKITGPTPMTRLQRHRWQLEAYRQFNFTIGIHGDITESPQFPRTSALYRLAVKPHHGPGTVATVACMHPDGSLFYEYVEGSRKDF